MTVKDHYDNHLGYFYSWYTGDFDKNKETFKTFCLENNIRPQNSGYAIDLGAGNGIQSVALVELGFQVKAIDFSKQLLAELQTRTGDFSIEVINDDIKLLRNHSLPEPELIICCGDTLAHLDSFAEVQKIIKDTFDVLSSKGKLILSFRDYSEELKDIRRFIPVKSDSQRILTCFIEYFPDKIRVTDLLHVFENGNWVQKVSSYYKTRINREVILEFLQGSGFKITFDKILNRMVTIIGEKY